MPIFFLLFYSKVCICVCVCEVKRGMWNWATNTMKYVTEKSICGVSFFKMKGLTCLEFNELYNGLF